MRFAANGLWVGFTAGLALAASLALALAPGAAAAPGDLDPRFSRNGLATAAKPGCQYGRALAIEPDGDVVVAGLERELDGRRYCGSRDTMALARFAADGKPDRTFGERGVALLPPRQGALGVGVQSDGRIVAGGGTSLARAMPDGTPDSSFGDGGVAASPVMSITALAVQADDRILLAGNSTSGACRQGCVAFARLLPNGQPDPAFDGDGITQFFEIGSFGVIRSLAPTPDGGLVAGGYRQGAFNTGRGLWIGRIRADGSPDATFSEDGVQLVDNAGRASFGSTNAAAAPLGNAGVAAVGQFDARLGAARLGPDGSIDSSFGTGGVAIASRFTPKEEVAWGNAVSPGGNGSLLASGTTARVGLDPGSGGRDSIDMAHDFALARFTAAGALDPGFAGGDGRRATDFWTGEDRSAKGAMAPGGQYVMAGNAVDAMTDEDLAVARYTLAPGRPDADADGLRDRRDACPDAFDRRGDGCPTLRRRLKLDYSHRRDAFVGELRSHYVKCFGAKPGPIEILRARPGRDQVLFEERAFSNFKAKYGAPRGNFYARIGTHDLTVRGVCGADRTRKLKLP